MVKPSCPGQDSRYWTPDDITELPCPHCGHELEFFKDEPSLACPCCSNRVPNPKVDQGCAQHCQHGKLCTGDNEPEE